MNFPHSRISHRTNPAPLRIGLIGAGTFVRDAYIPSLRDLRDQFDLVAIFSRTKATATARADQWYRETSVRPDVCTNVDELLAREDIDAVIVALPISLMPDFVFMALAAGKHVLSEKPIAPNTDAARSLYALYQNYVNQTWMVAENWRYESAFRTAADMVGSGTIGQVNSSQFSLYLPVTPESKYWKTAWRRDWDFPGGWLLDGGVHHVAAMRAVIGEISQVQAFTTLSNSQLAPLDTITATLEFESGALGTYAATYAVGSGWPAYLHVAGDKGSLRIQRGQIDICQDDSARSIACPKFDGVLRELEAFYEAVQYDRPHLNTAAEGLRDLAAIEAMLESGRFGQAISPDYRLLAENPPSTARSLFSNRSR